MNHPASLTTPRPGRLVLLGLSTVAAALTVSGFFAMVPMAHADGSFACPDTPPGINNGSVFPGYDNNTNVFVGSNFSVAETAAEAEGKMVVMGNASFEKADMSRYNVGVVGVGALVPPTPNSDMLLVGGDLGSNGTTIDVGSLIGGAVRIGGENKVPTGKLDVNGATVTASDSTAVSDYTEFPALLTQRSNAFSASADTGAAAFESWGAITFTGDNASRVQTFTVQGNTLGSESKAASLQFLDIPDGAQIVINVIGGPSAGLFLNAVLDGAGSPISTTGSSVFADLASRIVWNFEAAKDVRIGGSAQVPGLILVPTSGGTTDISAPGTNGRILVAGDLLHRGSGSELHRYALAGDKTFGCKVPEGSAPVTSAAVTTAASSTTSAAATKPAPGATTTPALPAVTTSAATAATTTVAALGITQSAPAKLEAEFTTSVSVQADTTEVLANTGVRASSILIFGGAALLFLVLGVLTVTTVSRRH
ncbi:choice-of-anchor A family protein [Arthrobacter antibioticus]|uniref:choice-of-anchor A family protein n=1 Tax=Arthrobacter sp. H35-MC1 TaxID=3046203 RepID=UPI0024BAB06A|nr:choice-of-anchor A family protein [Arthrobacter sp. H35-MC1]MDJ0316871.1 choice-of-anchor A family protein [Arthrobacter sp. H35-MC1]